MITLQKYLNQKHPTREDKEKVEQIFNFEYDNLNMMKLIDGLEGGELDLSDFPNLKRVSLDGNRLKPPLTKLILGKQPLLEYLDINTNHLTYLDVSGCDGLRELLIERNNLNSVQFLNDLPNPERLERLLIYSNNIEPTDIETFSKFVNLKRLKMGSSENDLKQNKKNRFYGSFKSWKNLTKLESICIEATDVNEGLEYLPFSLSQIITEKKKKRYSTPIDLKQIGYSYIECSPHNTNAKCSAIQNELRPFNYDLEAWQLAHPHLMYRTKPEIFFDSELKSRWLIALRNKVNKTQEKLDDIKQKNPNKLKKIKRLETKLQLLKTIQDNISTHSLLDKLQNKKLKKVENKATQTEFIEIKK